MRLPKIMDDNRGRDIALVAALGVVQAALMMAAAFATRVVFGAIGENGPLPMLALAVLLVTPILLAGCQALARVQAEAAGQSYAVALRGAVFQAIASLPPAVRAKRSLGGLSLRFVGDLSAARGWVGLGITRMVSGVIVLPAAVVTLWVLNPALALAGIAPVVVSMVAFVVIGRQLKRRHSRLRKRRADVAITAIERIDRARDLALAGRLKKELSLIRRKGEDAADHAVARIRTTSLLRMIPNASLGLGGVAVLVTALRQGLSTGEAAASLAVLAILIVPMRQWVGIWDKYAAWTVARDKCKRLFDAAETLPATRRLGEPAALTLSHPELPEPITVEAGAITRLDGVPPRLQHELLTSVAGISDAAEVTFDCAKRPLVAYVSDDPLILKGSLRRAATMGARKRPQDKVIMRALDWVGLTEVLANGGLDQKLGSGGAPLSPELRLRLSVAQALLTEPDVIAINSALWQGLEDGSALFAQLQSDTSATILYGAALEPVASDLDATRDGSLPN